MVARWWRLRTPGWQFNAAINAIGAATTFTVLLILAWTKFAEGQALFTMGGFTVDAGAWIVLVMVPLMVLLFLRINKHYEGTPHAQPCNRRPALGRAAAAGVMFPPSLPEEGAGPGPRSRTRSCSDRHLVVMPIAGLNQVTLRTLAYARSMTDNVVAVHVAADEEAAGGEAGAEVA